MRILFDDDLVEAVVFLCASGKRPGLPALQVRRFHAERERVYAILDPDKRAAGFAGVNQAWFREWGLEKWLAVVVARFPMLERSLQALGFRKARRNSEEGAELYVNSDGERHGIVALGPERFAQGESLSAFLHHELMHLSDMVDPAFDYSPDLGESGHTASQLRLIRERYRLLWDVTIDGRLEPAPNPTIATQEQRRSEFDRAFGFLDAEKRSSMFCTLWTGKSPRHRDLLALASDPRELNDAGLPAPGAPCPLCGFATFEWVAGRRVKDETVAAIRRDFPGWMIAQGVCHRCVEIYEASSGLELPATVCL